MLPRFIAIKSALVDDIELGRLAPGDQVESENQLAQRSEVSRMTARRALTELVTEGILARTQGVGTFVADSRPMSSILTIKGIKDEILARGHQYHCQVVIREQRYAAASESRWLGVKEASPVYFTSIIHYENDLPVQLENRWVNPHWAPDYLKQDFTVMTPNHYLTQVAPLTEADHVVSAIIPDTDTAEKLMLTPSEPCLQIDRRTYSARGIVSVATLTHPGKRYRLGGHLDFTQTP